MTTATTKPCTYNWVYDIPTQEPMKTMMSIEEEIHQLWISIRTLTNNIEVMHGIIAKLEKAMDAKRRLPHWTDMAR